MLQPMKLLFDTTEVPIEKNLALLITGINPKVLLLWNFIKLLVVKTFEKKNFMPQTERGQLIRIYKQSRRIVMT